MFKAIVAPTNAPAPILPTDGTLAVQPDPDSGDAFAAFLNLAMDDLDLEQPESPPDLTGLVAMAPIDQSEMTQAVPELAPTEAPSPSTLATPDTLRQWPEVFAGLSDPEGAKPSPGLDLTGLDPTGPPSTPTGGTVEIDPMASAASTTDIRPQPDASGTDHSAHPTAKMHGESGIVPTPVAGSTVLPGTGYEPVLRSEYPAGEAVLASSGIERLPSTPPTEIDAFSTRLSPVSATLDEKIATVSLLESAPAATTAGSSEPTSGTSLFGAASSSTPTILPSPAATPTSLASPPSAPTLVATPAQVPEILSQSMGSDEDRRDRIIVQLDPPELGRVSLEFKFDVQGLQTVTVSSETPEAMRRLRLMHFELVQALEQQGLSADNLSYSQQQSRQHAYQPPSRWAIDTPAFQALDIADRSIAVGETRNTSRRIDGLDMRV